MSSPCHGTRSRVLCKVGGDDLGAPQSGITANSVPWYSPVCHPVFDYGTIVGGGVPGAPRARDGIGFVGGDDLGAPRARDGIGFVGGGDPGAPQSGITANSVPRHPRFVILRRRKPTKDLSGKEILRLRLRMTHPVIRLQHDCRGRRPRRPAKRHDSKFGPAVFHGLSS